MRLRLKSPLTGRLKPHVDQQIAIYKNACSNHKVQNYKSSKNAAIFVIYCESYKGASIGEVAFFKVQLTDRTLVKNYYHIRVPRYSLSSGKVPLSQQQQKEGLAAVSRLTLSAP